MSIDLALDLLPEDVRKVVQDITTDSIYLDDTPVQLYVPRGMKNAVQSAVRATQDYVVGDVARRGHASGYSSFDGVITTLLPERLAKCDKDVQEKIKEHFTSYAIQAKLVPTSFKYDELQVVACSEPAFIKFLSEVNAHMASANAPIQAHVKKDLYQLPGVYSCPPQTAALFGKEGVNIKKILRENGSWYSRQYEMIDMPNSFRATQGHYITNDYHVSLLEKGNKKWPNPRDNIRLASLVRAIQEEIDRTEPLW